MTTKDCEILYIKYNKSLVYFAMSYVHQMQVAEDMVAQAFLNLLQRIDLIGVVNFSFLKTSVKNECLDYLKSNGRHLKVHKIILEESEGFEKMAEYRGDLMAMVVEEIKKCSPQQRRIVELKLFHHLEYKEIAEALKISVNTVRVLHNRCMNKIKRMSFE